MASQGLTRSQQQVNATTTSAFPDIANISSTAVALPTVDVHKLKDRLYSHAPKQAPVNPSALRFKGPTQVQIKKMGIPSEPRTEPLVC